MNIFKNRHAKDKALSSFTFLQWFRLVFTVFSIFLMVDVFWRWDGFKVHSSFAEYLPNVALSFFLWTILALMVSILIWLPFIIFRQIIGYFKIKLKAEHFVLYLLAVILTASLAWAAKKVIWADVPTSLQLKLTVIILISCATIPLTWLFRNKAVVWVNEIRERITPLVWLFTTCIILSSMLIAYQMWGNNTVEALPKVAAKSTMAELGKKRPNILLVTFDALTARDMSVYGYHRETTPFIEKWSKTASLFTRMKAQSNHTATTIASLMTGKRVWTHRKYQFDLAAKPRKAATENLARVLKENGYYTAAFVQNIVASTDATGISASFDISPSFTEFLRPASIEGVIDKYLFLMFGNKFTTYNWLGQDDFIFSILLSKIPQKLLVTEYPPKLVFDRFLEEMDDNPHKPFFAWLHIFPPHAPRLVPHPFAGTFNPSTEMREKNAMYSFRPELNKYANKYLPFPKEIRRKVALIKDYYDEFILYCDKQFENFIGELEKRDFSKDTVIIVSADHGDSFEHDYFTHNRPHLYEQVTHIPLIIKEPGQTVGRTVDNLLEQIDIPVTILDLAGIPCPSWMQGQSFLPLLRDVQLPPKPALSMNFTNNSTTEPITTGSVAIWEGNYKLVYYIDRERYLLFNLEKDSGETNNLFYKEPDIGQQLLSSIKNRLKEANKKIIQEEGKGGPKDF